MHNNSEKIYKPQIEINKKIITLKKKKHYCTCKILCGNGNDLTNSNTLCTAMALLTTARIDNLY